MAADPIENGYQIWGHGNSWVVEHYAIGQLTWQSQWFTNRERAEAEMRRLQGRK